MPQTTLRSCGRRTVAGLSTAALTVGMLTIATGSSHAAGTTIGSGTISWGLKASFRSYLTGPIAHGTITATAPATNSASSTTFPNARGTWSGTSASVAAAGAVRFYGHDGALNLTIASPQIKVSGATAQLVVDAVDSHGIRHDDVAFADIALAGKVTTTASGVTVAAAPTTITAAGSTLLSYNGSAFYPAGTALDPISASFKAAAPAVVKSSVKPSLKVTKKPTRKAKGKAVVKVTGAKGKPAPTGKVRVKLTKGTSNKYVTAKLSKGKRTIALPKLAKGRWTVRVAYLKGDKLHKARGYVKTGTIKVTR